MQNRRGFSLTPMASLGAGAAPPVYGTPSPNRPPMYRSDQLSSQQGARTGSPPARQLGSRQNGFNQFRNSSDGVAAVLGGSTFARPNTRSRSEVATPNRPQWFKGGTPPSRGGADDNATLGNSPSVAGAPPSYECKVLTSSGKVSNNKLKVVYGAGCTQGMRPTMEDAHFSVVDVPAADGTTISLFGILDGHCGRRVADISARALPDAFFAHPAIGQNNAAALVESVVQCDKAVFQQIGRADGGSTLIAAALHNRMLFVANLGDARAVLYDGTSTVAMSIDHKPMDPAEQARIVRCGGMVHFGRVNGCLAVSRALGDFEFKFSGHRYASKEFMVSNIADIRQINVTDATKFLVLACDGLWDVLTNEEATAFVNSFMQSADPRDFTRALNACAQQLCQHAVDAGSMDNVSVLIVFFHAPEGPTTGAGGGGGPLVSSGSNGMTPPVRLPPSIATPKKR